VIGAAGGDAVGFLGDASGFLGASRRRRRHIGAGLLDERKMKKTKRCALCDRQLDRDQLLVALETVIDVLEDPAIVPNVPIAMAVARDAIREVEAEEGKA
jgi:hypothetical protein